MAAPPEPKSGDSDYVIHKLCEIFSKAIEQQQLEIFKHTVLEPNPVKLSGPGNYISWAHHADLILGSHGYANLLTGDADEEVIKDGTSSRRINDKVLAWLFGSMEPAIREQVEMLPTVCEVWAALRRRLAGKVQATRVMHELSHLRQGPRSVAEYGDEVKRLYRHLHCYHPFDPVDKRDMAIHGAWFEPFVGKLFLDGLNEQFDHCRRMIFSRPEWPSLDDIITSVMEEEARQKMDSQRVDDAGATSSTRTTFAYGSSQGQGQSKLFSDY